MLTPGLMIGGKYRLLREIGSGAMGRVWAALNELTAREVALKLLIGRDEELRLRLQREARSCGALQHRNIVDVYDVAQTDEGDPVLVMQLLSGETLADLLVSRRRLESPLAASIGRDIAHALAAMHGLGIVHRDLKPANIFLHREPDGERPVVKVLDFGVSKNIAARDDFRTALGGAVGTLLYMSPEQVQARSDVDSRADIWSLGVLLFEMLTGVRPFQGEFAEVMFKIVRGEIPSASQLVRHVDPPLVSIVSGCLCRERELRLGPAATIARMLDACVGPGDPWALPAPAALLADGPASRTSLMIPGGAPPGAPQSRREPARLAEGSEEVDDEALTQRFDITDLTRALRDRSSARDVSPIPPPPVSSRSWLERPGPSSDRGRGDTLRPDGAAPSAQGAWIPRPTVEFQAGPAPGFRPVWPSPLTAGSRFDSSPSFVSAPSSLKGSSRPGSIPLLIEAVRPTSPKKVFMVAAGLLATIVVSGGVLLAMLSSDLLQARQAPTVLSWTPPAPAPAPSREPAPVPTFPQKPEGTAPTLPQKSTGTAPRVPRSPLTSR